MNVRAITYGVRVDDEEYDERQKFIEELQALAAKGFKRCKIISVKLVIDPYTKEGKENE